uniref:Uncharacterized protein n=1 Tax=Sphaerodactylus townsendi TaxID=933632 RepID=A0ACB8GB01_9SAUR
MRKRNESVTLEHERLAPSAPAASTSPSPSPQLDKGVSLRQSLRLPGSARPAGDSGMKRPLGSEYYY